MRYSWAGPGRWPSWPQPAPVCRWHAGLHQHTGWWRWGCSPTSYCVSRRYRGMVEGQPTSTELHQDAGNVVGFSTTAGESQRFAGSGGVGTYQRLGDSPYPWRHRRQPADAVCTGGRRVSQWLLPVTAAPTARQIDVIWRRLGVYFVSPGLLQFDVLRHHRRSDEQAALCTECSCAVGFRPSMLWPHNAGATRAALASGSASGGLQDGHSGLLVTVRYGSTLLGRRLSAGLRRRSSSTQGHVSSEGPAAAMEM